MLGPTPMYWSDEPRNTLLASRGIEARVAHDGHGREELRLGNADLRHSGMQIGLRPPDVGPTAG